MSFPTTSVLSTFTGTDDTSLDEGGNWAGTVREASATIGLPKYASNQAAPDSTYGTCEAYWYQSFGANQEAYVTVATKPADGDWCAILFRVQNPGNPTTAAAYEIELDSVAGTDTITVWRLSGGSSWTQVTDGTLVVSQEVANGDSFGASIVGSTITIYHKPSAGSWTQVGTGTDANLSGSGYVGIAMNVGSEAHRLDGFGGGEIASGAEYIKASYGVVGTKGLGGSEYVAGTPPSGSAGSLLLLGVG